MEFWYLNKKYDYRHANRTTDTDLVKIIIASSKSWDLVLMKGDIFPSWEPEEPFLWWYTVFCSNYVSTDKTKNLIIHQWQHQNLK